jgi:hypothetical protein
VEQIKGGGPLSNIVFILGAGASKDCGAPLMADFLDIASYLYHTGATEEKKDDFERVFRAIGSLQMVHSKAQLDLTNIESIFSALEIAKILGKLPGTPADEIPRAITSLKELIVKTLELTIDFPTMKSYIGVPYPYEDFGRLLDHLRSTAFPPHTVSVITFNYDIAADMALFRAGLGPDYGIPPCHQKNLVPLLKLHGSLNWGSREDNGEVYPMLLKDYFSKYSIMGEDERGKCKVPVGSQLKEYFSKHTDVKVAAEPVIVPPTWNKTEHHQALSKVWANAANQLEEAEYIFIIGYSLPETDSFFRLLYALGTVGKNPLKKIVVYNPDNSNQVNSRFRSLLGPGAIARYEYKKNIFREAIIDIWNSFPDRH